MANKPKKDELEGVEETIDMAAEETSETIAQDAVSAESAAPAPSHAPRKFSVAPAEEKPKSNIMTMMLIIALVFTITAIVIIGIELNQFYGCTFGGIVKPPEGMSQEPVTPDEQPADEAPAEPEAPAEGGK